MDTISKSAIAIYWLKALLCSLFLLVIAPEVTAQTDTTRTEQTIRNRWIIETTDGSVIQGRYMGQDELGIRIMTDSTGEIFIPHNKIKSTRIVDESRFRNGEYWFDNPNETRYLFAPSAYSLKKGEAYYQNTYLILNSFYYGLTDNFTIGGGFELTTLFQGEPAFYITPKYTFPIAGKLRGGGGILYANALGASEDVSGIGIGYGILTYGTTDNNATFGLGYGYVDGSFSKKPVLNFNGMARVSRRIGLVTENWFVPIDDYYGLLSYGLRFMGERMTVDLAFINNKDISEEILIGIPYVDFVIKFGK